MELLYDLLFGSSFRWNTAVLMSIDYRILLEENLEILLKAINSHKIYLILLFQIIDTVLSLPGMLYVVSQKQSFEIW